MKEILGGYFGEEHVRMLFRGCGAPIPETQPIDLHDPAIQRKVGRMSVVRAWALYNEQGENPVEVFHRYFPTPVGGKQDVVWVVDFSDSSGFERARRFYQGLIGFEGRPDTEEVIRYIDDFCGEEL